MTNLSMNVKFMICREWSKLSILKVSDNIGFQTKNYPSVIEAGTGRSINTINIRVFCEKYKHIYLYTPPNLKLEEFFPCQTLPSSAKM